jgi:hypothetical protein
MFLIIAPSLPPLIAAAVKPATVRELSEAYDAARRASLAGDHQTAMNLLLPNRQRGPASPTIDFALGTAAARLERPGEALAYLESSVIMAPRNRDTRANWTLVHESLPDASRTSEAFPQRWHSFLSPVEWFLTAAFTYISGWAMLSVGILNRGPDRQPGMVRGAGVLLGVSVVLTVIFLLSRSHATRGAYVSSPRPTALRSGPGTGFKALLELSPGSRVQLETIRQDSGYYVILLPGGGSGYIPASDLTPVSVP